MITLETPNHNMEEFMILRGIHTALKPDKVWKVTIEEKKNHTLTLTLTQKQTHDPIKERVHLVS